MSESSKILFFEITIKKQKIWYENGYISDILAVAIIPPVISNNPNPVILPFTRLTNSPNPVILL